ncbi:MAG: tripartite tricarboxylate transporter substrate binding protein [Burkholderiales bacterium]
MAGKRRAATRRIGVLVASAIVAASVFVAASPAIADEFPSKPIRLIVPFPAGGQSDVLARVVGKYIGQNTGQTVVVDNRGGAGGMVGAEVLANATPDGYTIGMLSTPHVTYPAVMKPAYDPKALRAITNIALVPSVLSVNVASPHRTLADILVQARARPGALTSGNAGNLSTSHLAMELLKQRTGVDIQVIPYKGGAPSLQDLLGGQIDMAMGGPSALMQHVKGGRLRAIAVTGAKRSTAMPEVPTFAESGVPGFEMNEWYALFAPARTPPAVIARLHQEVVRALKEPEVRNTLIAMGAEPVADTPAELEAFYLQEMDRLGKLVRQLGLKAE